MTHYFDNFCSEYCLSLDEPNKQFDDVFTTSLVQVDNAELGRIQLIIFTWSRKEHTDILETLDAGEWSLDKSSFKQSEQIRKPNGELLS